MAYPFELTRREFLWINAVSSASGMFLVAFLLAGIVVFWKTPQAAQAKAPAFELSDGDGNRVRKTINGLTTLYLVDDLNPTGYAQVLEELVSSPSSLVPPLVVSRRGDSSTERRVDPPLVSRSSPPQCLS